MFSAFRQSPPANGARPVASAPAQSGARWAYDDDLALGCESADPALQIESWHPQPGPIESARA